MKRKATIIDMGWITDMARKAAPRSRTPVTRFMTSVAGELDPNEPVVPAWLCKYFEKAAK